MSILIHLLIVPPLSHYFDEFYSCLPNWEFPTIMSQNKQSQPPQPPVFLRHHPHNKRSPPHPLNHQYTSWLRQINLEIPSSVFVFRYHLMVVLELVVELKVL